MFHGFFPTTLSEVNDHFGIVVPYLNTNKTRLMIATNADLIAVTARHTTNWLVNYPLAANAATSNKTNRDDRDADLFFIERGLKSVYGEIPESVFTNDDRNTLHIHNPNAAHERQKIENNVFLGLKNEGGGRVLFSCRRGTEGGHVSIDKDADVIQFYGRFAEQPANIEECNVRFDSKSAHFTKDMGLDHVGQRFFVFARYVNQSDESKNGPVSTIYSITIGG